MKNLIRQILREETSGLTDGQIKAGYSLMNHLTKGYHLYSTPYATWLINPETKEWMLEFQNFGYLWYHKKTPDIFYKYLNMERSDFESFIMIWVEDVFKRPVLATPKDVIGSLEQVEGVLKNGKQMK